jgi:glycosyltransferase involved in cell wall biosynthesis
MTRMRVALYSEIFLPKIDGIVRIICLLMEHLRRIDAEVVLYVPGKHPESYAGYPVVSLPGVSFPLYPEITVSIPTNKYRDILADFNPDIVHVINPVFTGTRGIHFARDLKKPVIASFHTNVMEAAEFYGLGIFKETLWQIHKLIYGQADKVLATSHYMVNELIAHDFGDVGLWRRGVDVERFSPDFATDEMRYRLSDGHVDRSILMYTGRLAAEKQIEQIVHVLDNVPDTHLALVGDGPHREKLEEIFAGRNVTYLGYMRGDELSTAYASADIFVFPSSLFETFGLVVAEAMASGLGVVSSRVGGVPEIITQGENGFMFEVNDTQAMVDYVRILAEDPAKRLEFGHRARQAVTPLSWEAIMDELFEVYAELIHNRMAIPV